MNAGQFVLVSLLGSADGSEFVSIITQESDAFKTALSKLEP
jgi:hypothetical protein